MKKAVVSLGRFNPPTIGHEEVIKQAVSMAKKQSADLYVFTTKTQDNKKNPLEIGTKLSYLRIAFPGITFIPVKGLIEALQILNQDKIEDLIFIAGIDRIDGYKNTIQKGIDGNHINIKQYSLIPLLRDPDSEGVEGASATKARQFAVNGNKEEFLKIAPSTLTRKQKESLYNKVRIGMQIDG